MDNLKPQNGLPLHMSTYCKFLIAATSAKAEVLEHLQESS